MTAKTPLERTEDFSRGWDACRAALKPIRRMEASFAFIIGLTTGAFIATVIFQAF